MMTARNMEIKSAVVDLPTTSIYAASTGEGPLVICMHGITGNAYVFEPIMRELADSFHIVSIDQRGHGRSGRPDGFRAQDFVADIAALIRHLDRGPAILLGHSLGARNAIVAGALYPELISSVVALDFTPYIEDEVLQALEDRVNGGDRLFESEEEIKTYLSGRYPFLPPDAIARRAHYGYVQVENGWRPLAGAEAMQKTAAGLREDLEQPLLQLKVPTVLVRGEVSKLVSKAAWERTLKLRPDLPAIEVPGSDHYIPEVKPFDVVEIVRNRPSH